MEFEESEVFGGDADGGGDTAGEAAPAVEEGAAKDDLFNGGGEGRGEEVDSGSTAAGGVVGFCGMDAVIDLAVKEGTDVSPGVVTEDAVEFLYFVGRVVEDELVVGVESVPVGFFSTDEAKAVFGLKGVIEPGAVEVDAAIDGVVVRVRLVAFDGTG